MKILLITAFLLLPALSLLAEEKAPHSIGYDPKDKKTAGKINDDHIIARKVSHDEQDSLSVSGGNIYFEINKSEINQTEKIRLWEIARALKKLENKIKIVFIEGFASPGGEDDKNYTLAVRRAESVKGALIKEGVSKDILEIRSLGEAQEYKFDNIDKRRRVQLRLYLK